MLGDGTEVLTDSDDAEMFDDEEGKEKDDEALVGKGEDEEMKDIALKSGKGKENSKIDSTTSSKIAPPTDEKPKEVASK